MKQKVLYITDRPSMGADMLAKSLGDTFEVLWARSRDEVKHVPGLVLVNLAGLESPERVKSLTDTRIFLLGNQAEVDGSELPCAGKFIKPFKDRKSTRLNSSHD